MKYLTRNGQNIFDLIINTNGDFNKTYDLIIANPTIKSIEEVPIGIEVVYTPPPVTPPGVKSVKFTPPVTEQNFYSRSNQTIYDVVLQTYGDLNLTYKLIEDSKFNNLNTYPIPTTLFKFNPQLIADSIFANYLAKNSMVLNSRTSISSGQTQEGSLQTDDGIDITTDGGSIIIVD